MAVLQHDLIEEKTVVKRA